MNDQSTSLDPKAETQRLSALAELALQEAKALGATQTELSLSTSQGLSVSARLGDVETIEHEKDKGLGITVYVGKKKASTSTTDFSEAAIKRTVAAAIDLARYTAEDEAAGLAEPELMIQSIPDLDLYHPWGIEIDQAIEQVKRCEHAAQSFDARITNSEGASLSWQEGVSVYANSHGLIAPMSGTRHSLSCVAIAGESDQMQRDYWYSSNRNPSLLASAESIGQEAAERTLRRLNPRKIKTGTYPVLFAPDMARSLLQHLVSAVSGGALYRRSSFLLDHKGQSLFPDFVHIEEQPLEHGGMGSSAFDSDGLARRQRYLVQDGVLQDYVLSSYSARRLGVQSTANAGGVRNLTLHPGEQSFEQLLSQMGTGLLVTEMMGSGAKMTTGDYSRGAGGFWVENGQITFPVQELTIAGNLKSMFQQIQAVGSDTDKRANVRCGSILIDAMMVAGG